MNRKPDFSQLRTESDIKLARANIRHEVLLRENLIRGDFHNFTEYFMNALKIVAVQTGTSILTATLVRLIQSRKK